MVVESTACIRRTLPHSHTVQIVPYRILAVRLHCGAANLGRSRLSGGSCFHGAPRRGRKGRAKSRLRAGLPGRIASQHLPAPQTPYSLVNQPGYGALAAKSIYKEQ